jgi:predicted RNase H-like nuclease/ppGpp synthetase/RelA/SpoT-type nucleotidyltranferase
VHYVGIDLAWGERQPTGLAVLDADARLLHVSAVRTDEEIEAGLAAYVGGDCLVAIDAPLVVRNATGSRPAEKALSKDFRRFDAGTHPSNTGKPEFAAGPRGARVAKALGLDIDPRSGRARRAIEVYPHAATIVLFGLEKILRYKNKQGRDLELLRSELLVLMGHVEATVATDETWAGLRLQVEQATRKSELRRVEDQVDAVVCAVVALVAHRSPDQVTTYGDLETGYIVTPTLGSAPTRTDVVRAAVQAYAADHDDLTRAGQEAVALVQGLLDEAGINYLSVTGRTKSVASFAEKAGRMLAGVPAYADPLTQITDQLGVRVITYVEDDVDAVADLLGEQVIVQDDRDMGQETADEGRFGYASRHLMIALDPAREGHPDFEHLRGRAAQVQVRTVLQHAWAEFEHDIRYKGTVPAEHAREFDRRFALAAGLLELADREFSQIRERLRGVAAEVRVVPDDDPRIDPRELAAFLAGQYAQAGWSRTEHYGWISGLLLELGITSLDELGEVLRSVDEAAISARMDYRHPPGAVRRLDDALLCTYAERFVELHGNAHRRDGLAARLAKLTGPASAAAGGAEG